MALLPESYTEAGSDPSGLANPFTILGPALMKVIAQKSAAPYFSKQTISELVNSVPSMIKRLSKMGSKKRKTKLEVTAGSASGFSPELDQIRLTPRHAREAPESVFRHEELHAIRRQKRGPRTIPQVEQRNVPGLEVGLATSPSEILSGGKNAGKVQSLLKKFDYPTNRWADETEALASEFYRGVPIDQVTKNPLGMIPEGRNLIRALRTEGKELKKALNVRGRLRKQEQKAGRIDPFNKRTAWPRKEVPLDEYRAMKLKLAKQRQNEMLDSLQALNQRMGG